MNKAELYHSIVTEALLRKYPRYSDTSRMMRNVWCRICVAYFLYSRKLTLVEIGKAMHRDHTTVGYYLSKYNDYMKYDSSFREFSEELDGLFARALDIYTDESEISGLSNFTTEALFNEIKRRTIMHEYYFMVDGFSVCISADSYDSAIQQINDSYPDASYREFIRVCDLHDDKIRK